jgi:hypothetical protein
VHVFFCFYVIHLWVTQVTLIQAGNHAPGAIKCTNRLPGSRVEDSEERVARSDHLIDHATVFDATALTLPTIRSVP